MRSIRRTALVACLALVLPSLVQAWPAALQTGTPIRVTASTLGDMPVTGSFTRHDDSALTFKPENSRHAVKVRYADIVRLEADMNPAQVSNRSTLVLGVLGAAAGFGAGMSIGVLAGSTKAGLLLGAIAVIPGFIVGGLAGGLLGGAAATAESDHTWVELPRASWAGEVALRSSAAADSTTR